MVSTKLANQTLDELKAFNKSLRMAIKNKESQTILDIASALTRFIAEHSRDFGDLVPHAIEDKGREYLSKEEYRNCLKAVSKASGIESDFEVLKTKPIRQTILEIGIKLERNLQNLIRDGSGG